ncbi:hypothetical protein ACVB8X_06895 [Streptomyces sp. NRAIS4]
MEGWKFWWGIAAFFLGGLANQFNGWITYRRQRVDKAADAAAAVAQQRKEFELQHLVEVHRLLRDCLASLQEHAIARRNLSRSEPPAEPRQDADDVAQQFMTSAAALEAQVGFILDDGVRELVRHAAEVLELADADVLLREPVDFGALGGAVKPAFEALSARVRELYVGRGTS